MTSLATSDRLQIIVRFFKVRLLVNRAADLRNADCFRKLLSCAFIRQFAFYQRFGLIDLEHGVDILRPV